MGSTLPGQRADGTTRLTSRHCLSAPMNSEAFRKDPSKVWQFYHYRRSVVLSAAPNPAHLTLAKLLLGFKSQTDTVRSRMMPNAQSFHLITQNVDGLSGRALQEIHSDSLSTEAEPFLHAARDSIIEMHGNLFKTICTKCGDALIDMRQPLSDGLAGTEDLSGDYRLIPTERLPRCTKSACGGLLRPGVVWFGESIPELDRIQPLVSRCDLILVLGTSSTVYPAAGFADVVKHSNHGKVALFNLDDPSSTSSADDDLDWCFAGPVEKLLSEVLGF